MEHKDKLVFLIPRHLRSKYPGNDVIEAGWAAGPSFVVRKTNKYTSPVSLADACNWLEEYRHVFKACHILLSDKSVIWMHINEFWRYDSDDSILRDSGTFIDVGKDKVEISKKMGLSEELTNGNLNEENPKE